MHTPETIFAEVSYRRLLAAQSWPAPYRSGHHRRRAQPAGAADPAPGTTLRTAFGDLFRLVRYRLRPRWPAEGDSPPRPAAITLRLTPAEEGALTGLARRAGISRHEATVQAIRQAASSAQR